MTSLSQSQIATPGVDSSTLSTVLAGSADVRLELVSGFLSLMPFNGRGIWINGAYVVVTTTSTQISEADDLINSSGVSTGSPPAASTLYYAYASQDPSGATALLALSAVVPTLADTGIYVLNTAGTGAAWRFVGCAYLNAGGTFEDSLTLRGVASWFNPRLRALFTCPNYVDDNANTTYTENTAAWAAMSGVSSVAFVNLHSQAPILGANFQVVVGGAAAVQVGLSCKQSTSISIGTTPLAAASLPAATGGVASVVSQVDGATPTTATIAAPTLVTFTAATNAAFVADFARNGATADPAATYLQAFVWC